MKEELFGILLSVGGELWVALADQGFKHPGRDSFLLMQRGEQGVTHPHIDETPNNQQTWQTLRQNNAIRFSLGHPLKCPRINKHKQQQAGMPEASPRSLFLRQNKQAICRLPQGSLHWRCLENLICQPVLLERTESLLEYLTTGCRPMAEPHRQRRKTAYGQAVGVLSSEMSRQ